ncbi:histidine kinase [Aquihabitans sp. McL0605]|uniref:GAF domain-containing sensor histidine kinase n=1 Tax=Aquihabitans sp. McL0605 TaxID=3415671 RepID=UPI003CF8EF8E
MTVTADSSPAIGGPGAFSSRGSGRGPADVRVDQVAAFRPAILGIRGGTTAVSVALASPAFADGDLWVVGWCFLVVGYNVFRIVRPLRYVDDTKSLLRVLGEVGFLTIAVAATGYWESPFVFALITAVMVAGFAEGFAFAMRVSIAACLAIGIPFLLQDGTTVEDIRTTAQWTVELILVALIAGYARRVTGEADRAHSLALDRLGRLADANTLLYSLHRVAQSLPASLDLEEVLDTTMGRLRDLFTFDAATLLLLDETDETWQVMRWDGPRPAPRYLTHELPAPLREALEVRHPVMVNELLHEGGGVSVEMTAGLYAALPARQAVVGLVALEHRAHGHFELRDMELLNGFVEPAALAVDNARWFARLRTVGADEERTRIARDLHDRIGQSLAYLAFELDRIVKTDGQGKPVSNQLGQLRNDVRSVIGEVRDTLYDLRTDVTDVKDMPATLQEFLDRVAARSSLETRLDLRVTGRLPLLQERELWRIAQEAVTNVERHAKASKVVVTWQSDGGRALLLIADDGIGFPTSRAGRLDSYGIVGMRERAASIGATLDISGTPDVGTTVRCEVRPI